MKTLALRQAQQSILPTTVSAAVTTVQLFPDNSVSPAVLPLIVTAAASGSLEQREFGIRASGKALTAGNYTLTLGLYAKVVVPASPLVAGSWTLLGASSARAINTTTAPFLFTATLISDSVSGLLHGTFGAIINNLVDANAAITALTGVNLAGSTEPAISFCLGATFGTGGANVATLTNFYLIG